MNKTKILRVLWFVLPILIMLTFCAISYFMLLNGVGMRPSALKL